jgi:hypothetical protein
LQLEHRTPGRAGSGSDDVDAIVAELVQAGLVTIGTDAGGRGTWALTPAGEQVANQIAMSAEDDGVALLTALLDANAT